MYNSTHLPLQLGPPSHHHGCVFGPAGADEIITSMVAAVPTTITTSEAVNSVGDGFYYAGKGSCTTATTGEASKQLDLPSDMDPRQT